MKRVGSSAGALARAHSRTTISFFAASPFTGPSFTTSASSPAPTAPDYFTFPLLVFIFVPSFCSPLLRIVIA